MFGIFKKTPRQEPRTPLVQNSRSDECATAVRWVAASANRVEFRERATSAAQSLGSGAIGFLSQMFHSEAEPPQELKARFSSLGGWMAARQFAIFEILYAFGEPSLPVLWGVVLGEYDWTQGNAIEVLCRLAADGVQSTIVLDRLKELMPEMREEAIYYAAGPLRQHASENDRLVPIIDELAKVPAFAAAWARCKAQR